MTGKTLHIKNIEKYHPGYKDRHLIWFKFYFTMLDGDDEFEMIDEIDKWRFVAFTVLELKNKKPILLDEKYLIRKGFDFKKKSLQKTLDAISPFVDICNIPVTENSDSVTHNRVEYNRIDKNRIEYIRRESEFNILWNDYPKKDGKKEALKHYIATVKTKQNENDIRRALNNYRSSVNETEAKFIKNGSTWFNNWEDWISVESKPKRFDEIGHSGAKPGKYAGIGEVYYGDDRDKGKEIF